MMEKWQRRLLGVLAIAGGGIGIASAFTFMLGNAQVLNWLFCLAFISLYSWGIWCGLKLLEDHIDAANANFRFWLIQIPTFSTPVIGYFFASGAYLTIWSNLTVFNMNFNMMLGSGFQYSLFNANQPLIAGINVFALVLTIWFYSKIPNKLIQPTANASAD